MGSLPLGTAGNPYEEGGAAFFPVTEYSVNKQMNELNNNKYYMSLIVYRDIFLYFYLLYFQVYLLTLLS